LFPRLFKAISAFFGSKNIVEFLINKNAQINQMDLLNSRTALHWAVANGNLEITKILIKAGKNFFVEQFGTSCVTNLLRIQN
jgi:ankyrin repeat protein